ncbi:MAG: hypothetical protein ACFB0B_00400 [Thermonemataceae bacterium]
MTEDEKIREGLELAYRRMIAFKKYKGTPVVVIRDGKVVEVDPHTIEIKGKVYK